MTVKLLTEHHLEFLSLKGGCTGSSESTLVKMPHCWKSHVTAQIIVKAHLTSSVFNSLFILMRENSTNSSVGKPVCSKPEALGRGVAVTSGGTSTG